MASRRGHMYERVSADAIGDHPRGLPDRLRLFGRDTSVKRCERFRVFCCVAQDRTPSGVEEGSR